MRVNFFNTTEAFEPRLVSRIKAWAGEDRNGCTRCEESDLSLGRSGASGAVPGKQRSSEAERSALSPRRCQGG
jgi:hypothetical protein